MGTEKHFSQTISCGHCSNLSVMQVVGQVYHDFAAAIEANPRNGPQPENGEFYNILICPACKKETVVKYYWDEFMKSENEVDCKILFPITKNMPLGLPEKIKSAYRAAEKVRNVNVNAYAILMRKLLELVCLDRKSTNGTLAQMLEDLAAKNEIPIKLVDVASGLKSFGNIGAHAESGELSEKEIPIVNALIKAILEYIYSAPYLATLAETKLKEIKTKNKKKNGNNSQYRRSN